MKVQLQLDKRFERKVKGMFGKYQFEVGVLQDAQHKEPRRGERGKRGLDVISRYAGGPVRKKSFKPSGMSISEVSAANRKRMSPVNYLTQPFKKQTSDIIKFTNSFFNLVFGRSQQKRCENLLQAVVRNPILRGDYGPNSRLAITIKGFNRSMIDTAQLFKAIKARTKRGRSV